MARSLQPFAIAVALSVGLAIGHGLGMCGLPLLLPAMLADLGWTYWHAGLLAAATAAGYVSGLVLALAAGPRVPPGRVFQLALLVAATALIATGAARDVNSLVLLRFISGLAAAALLVCGRRLAAAIYLYEPERSAKMIAIFDGGTAAGVVLAGAILPLMQQAMGNRAWPEMSFTLGLMGFASLPFVVWACGRIAVLAVGPAPTDWPWRRYAPVLAGYALFSAGMFAISTFLVLRAVEQGGHVVAVLALWTTFGLAGLLAPAFWQSMQSQMSQGRMVAATIGLAGAGAALALVPGSPALLVIAGAIMGFGAFMVPAATERLVRETLPREIWRPASSGIMLVAGFSQPVGALVAGWIALQTESLQAPMLVATGAVCAGALIALLQHAFPAGAPSATAPSAPPSSATPSSAALGPPARS